LCLIALSLIYCCKVEVGAFNIFQVYRQYFLLKFEQLYEYHIQHSLKSGGTKHHFRWVKVPGIAPN
jgi:hypothetical protein